MAKGVAPGDRHIEADDDFENWSDHMYPSRHKLFALSLIGLLGFHVVPFASRSFSLISFCEVLVNSVCVCVLLSRIYQAHTNNKAKEIDPLKRFNTDKIWTISVLLFSLCSLIPFWSSVGRLSNAMVVVMTWQILFSWLTSPHIKVSISISIFVVLTGMISFVIWGLDDDKTKVSDGISLLAPFVSLLLNGKELETRRDVFVYNQKLRVAAKTVDLLRDAVFRLDRQHKILSHNKVARRLLSSKKSSKQHFNLNNRLFTDLVYEPSKGKVLKVLDFVQLKPEWGNVSWYMSRCGKNAKDIRYTRQNRKDFFVYLDFTVCPININGKHVETMLIARDATDDEKRREKSGKLEKYNSLIRRCGTHMRESFAAFEIPLNSSITHANELIHGIHSIRTSLKALVKKPVRRIAKSIVKNCTKSEQICRDIQSVQTVIVKHIEAENSDRPDQPEEVDGKIIARELNKLESREPFIEVRLADLIEKVGQVLVPALIQYGISIVTEVSDVMIRAQHSRMVEVLTYLTRIALGSAFKDGSRCIRLQIAPETVDDDKRIRQIYFIIWAEKGHDILPSDQSKLKIISRKVDPNNFKAKILPKKLFPHHFGSLGGSSWCWNHCSRSIMKDFHSTLFREKVTRHSPKDHIPGEPLCVFSFSTNCFPVPLASNIDAEQYTTQLPKKLKVLICDPKAQNREMMAVKFSQEPFINLGWTVEFAINYDDFKKKTGSKRFYDIILIDLVLDQDHTEVNDVKAENGVQAMRGIRKKQQSDLPRNSKEKTPQQSIIIATIGSSDEIWKKKLPTLIRSGFDLVWGRPTPVPKNMADDLVQAVTRRKVATKRFIENTRRKALSQGHSEKVIRSPPFKSHHVSRSRNLSRGTTPDYLLNCYSDFGHTTSSQVPNSTQTATLNNKPNAFTSRTVPTSYRRLDLNGNNINIKNTNTNDSSEVQNSENGFPFGNNLNRAPSTAINFPNMRLGTPSQFTSPTLNSIAENTVNGKLLYCCPPKRVYTLFCRKINRGEAGKRCDKPLFIQVDPGLVDNMFNAEGSELPQLEVIDHQAETKSRILSQQRLTEHSESASDYFEENPEQSHFNPAHQPRSTAHQLMMPFASPAQTDDGFGILAEKEPEVENAPNSTHDRNLSRNRERHVQYQYIQEQQQQLQQAFNVPSNNDNASRQGGIQQRNHDHEQLIQEQMEKHRTRERNMRNHAHQRRMNRQMDLEKLITEQTTSLQLVQSVEEYDTTTDEYEVGNYTTEKKKYPNKLAKIVNVTSRVDDTGESQNSASPGSLIPKGFALVTSPDSSSHYKPLTNLTNPSSSFATTNNGVILMSSNSTNSNSRSGDITDQLLRRTNRQIKNVAARNSHKNKKQNMDGSVSIHHDNPDKRSPSRNSHSKPKQFKYVDQTQPHQRQQQQQYYEEQEQQQQQQQSVDQSRRVKMPQYKNRPTTMAVVDGGVATIRDSVVAGHRPRQANGMNSNATVFPFGQNPTLPHLAVSTNTSPSFEGSITATGSNSQSGHTHQVLSSDNTSNSFTNISDSMVKKKIRRPHGILYMPMDGLKKRFEQFSTTYTEMTSPRSTNRRHSFSSIISPLSSFRTSRSVDRIGGNHRARSQSPSQYPNGWSLRDCMNDYLSGSGVQEKDLARIIGIKEGVNSDPHKLPSALNPTHSRLLNVMKSADKFIPTTQAEYQQQKNQQRIQQEQLPEVMANRANVEEKPQPSEFEAKNEIHKSNNNSPSQRNFPINPILDPIRFPDDGGSLPSRQNSPELPSRKVPVGPPKNMPKSISKGRAVLRSFIEQEKTYSMNAFPTRTNDSVERISVSIQDMQETFNVIQSAQEIEQIQKQKQQQQQLQHHEDHHEASKDEEKH